jgi:hypothetical protein
MELSALVSVAKFCCIKFHYYNRLRQDVQIELY